MTTQSTIHNGADRWTAYDMLNDFVGPQIGKRYSIHTSTSFYILGELEFDGNLQWNCDPEENFKISFILFGARGQPDMGTVSHSPKKYMFSGHICCLYE